MVKFRLRSTEEQRKSQKEAGFNHGNGAGSDRTCGLGFVHQFTLLLFKHSVVRVLLYAAQKRITRPGRFRKAQRSVRRAKDIPQMVPRPTQAVRRNKAKASVA